MRQGFLSVNEDGRITAVFPEGVSVSDKPITIDPDDARARLVDLPDGQIAVDGEEWRA